MKNQRERRTWETAGMLLTLLLGNLLHFVYDWTGQASWAAYISAVNESTWEHMKLLAVPWILWTAVTILIERRADCAAPRAAGLLTGLILIPALFYTYTGCGRCWAFWCSWAQPRSSPCGRSIRRSCPFLWIPPTAPAAYDRGRNGTASRRGAVPFFAEIFHILLIAAQHRIKSPVFVERCRKMSNKSGTVRQITVAFSGEKCYF